jgi:hypothetical protein
MVQLVLHPSLLLRLLSSQTSSDAFNPSLHLDAQTLGWALPQSKPHSTKHVDEHPSLLRVSSSSHVSAPTTMPSPHTGAHLVSPHPVVLQSQPASMVQLVLHPSLLLRLPSSQTSSDAFNPSLHLDAQLLGSALQ